MVQRPNISMNETRTSSRLDSYVRPPLISSKLYGSILPPCTLSFRSLIWGEPMDLNSDSKPGPIHNQCSALVAVPAALSDSPFCSLPALANRWCCVWTRWLHLPMSARMPAAFLPSTLKTYHLARCTSHTLPIKDCVASRGPIYISGDVVHNLM